MKNHRLSLESIHSTRLTTAEPIKTMGGSVRINRWGLLLVGAVAFLVFYTFWGGKSVDKPIPSSTAPVSLKELLSVAIEAAHRGGVEVKRIREQVDDIGEKSKGETREGANNPVTDGDMLSHKAMYNSLRKAFPHVHVISEEDDPEQVDLNLIKMPHLTNDEINEIVKDDVLVPANDIDVWIDPLDATQEYTENLRHFVTTMVCVAVKGKPILGVIHKPFDGVTAWGWAGPNHVSQSIAEDVKKSQTQSDTDLSQSRIIVSRSHAGSVHDVAEKAFGAKAVVTPAGGAGYKAWEVVKGNQDVYVHVTLIKKWDICAGDAILNALGGQLTTLTGEKVDYSGRPAHEKNEGGVVATLHDHAAYVDALKHVEVIQGSKPK